MSGCANSGCVPYSAPLPIPEPAQASRTPSDVEVLNACFKDIDKWTDEILGRTKSAYIERKIDLVWNAVLDMYDIAVKSVNKLEPEEE